MTDRIAEAFTQARRGGRKLLCPFLTAGYPDQALTPRLLLAAQRGGAGCIELGIPFSDPVADGPVIQSSFAQALAQGSTLERALEGLRQARQDGLTVPVLIMVSFSVIFKRGTHAFAAACAAAGADGAVLPDLPLEEAPAVVAALRTHRLKSSLLVAPTTPPERAAAVARLCDAFVYYLSVSGITGERKNLPTDIGHHVAALRKVTPAPICVGFGISTPEQVRQVAQVADGAIVGSALVRRIAAQQGQGAQAVVHEVESFVRILAGGLDPQPAA